MGGPNHWKKELWNQFLNDGLRTNSNHEGWRHRLNNMSGKCHPNIYEHVLVMKRELSFTEARFTQACSHRRAPARKKRCYYKLDRRLQHLKDHLQRPEIMNDADQTSYLAHLR